MQESNSKSKVNKKKKRNEKRNIRSEPSAVSFFFSKFMDHLKGAQPINLQNKV